MVKNLFKKSYLHKNLSRVSYNNLWNTKGAFTTIRLKGQPGVFIFLEEHLSNLNQSLKKLNINFTIAKAKFNDLTKDVINKNINYDHLLRIAVNNKFISIDLRRRLKHLKFLKGIIVNYQRPNPYIKNLYYKKILNYLKKIDTKSIEILLMSDKKILEGCTTNIICSKKNKLYIPKKNYYAGITLKFLKHNTKRKIIKKNIFIKDLESFEEILLVGSGKGVAALKDISQIKWKKKSDMIFNELQDLYNSYINR